MKSNIEVHFFRGDPTKGQEPWMYSVRDSDGYRRCEAGANTLIGAALKAACEIEGWADMYHTLKHTVALLRCRKCGGIVQKAEEHREHRGVMKCVQCGELCTDMDCAMA